MSLAKDEFAIVYDVCVWCQGRDGKDELDQAICRIDESTCDVNHQLSCQSSALSQHPQQHWTPF